MSQFDKYIADGDRAIRLHPDYPGGVDYETAASDMIASILHAVFDGEYKPEDHDDPRSLIEKALRCYDGDQEDRLDDLLDAIHAARPSVEIDIPMAGLGNLRPQGLRIGIPTGEVLFASDPEGGMPKAGDPWSILVYENSGDYEDGVDYEVVAPVRYGDLARFVGEFRA